MRRLAGIALMVLLVGVGAAVYTGWPERLQRGSAHQEPEGCDAFLPIGAQIVPGAPIPVQAGDEIHYQVGAFYPGPSVGCTFTDIDVYVRLPGSKKFVHHCRIDELGPGDAVLCDEPVPYIAKFADSDNGALRAQVHVIANVHDSTEDCIVPEKQRNPEKVSNCVDSTGLNSLAIVP